jgi:nucleotide-binding universal stress UspA family protein
LRDHDVPLHRERHVVLRRATAPSATITVVRRSHQKRWVLHAPIPLLFEPTLMMAAAHMEEILELRRQAPALVKAGSDRIRHAAPGVSVTTKIVQGLPKEAIVQEAEDWGADLIVLGSHGYGRLRRTVLGSVAGAVVAKAPCSVQVVRAKHLLHTIESAA